jgi:mono/diheme cytochrome c family protein
MVNRKPIFILFTILFSLCFLGLSVAGNKGNSRKGKYLFRKNCRVCHRPGGKAEELGPIQKQTEEWESIFAPDKYKEFKCKSEWEKLSEQDLLDMLQYLSDGASDSKVPRGCG